MEKITTYNPRKVGSGIAALVLIVIAALVSGHLYKKLSTTTEIETVLMYWAFAYMLIAAIVICIVNTFKKTPIKTWRKKVLVFTLKKGLVFKLKKGLLLGLAGGFPLGLLWALLLALFFGSLLMIGVGLSLGLVFGSLVGLNFELSKENIIESKE